MSECVCVRLCVCVCAHACVHVSVTGRLATDVQTSYRCSD